MVGRRPTMKDVASRAGVAFKTVSRVINGEPGVSEETAQRVRRVSICCNTRSARSRLPARRSSSATPSVEPTCCGLRSRLAWKEREATA